MRKGGPKFLVQMNQLRWESPMGGFKLYDYRPDCPGVCRGVMEPSKHAVHVDHAERSNRDILSYIDVTA